MLPDRFGERFLDGMDRRCRAVRGIKARYDGLVVSLGGEAGLSYQEKSLGWRFVCLEAFIENLEQGLVEGREVDAARYLAALNTFAGLLNRLGLARRARDVATDPIEALMAEEL